MEKAGSVIPANAAAPAGQGIDKLIRSFEEAFNAARTQTWPRSPEEMEQSRQELVAAVFGPQES
jgi:hypothetical protein